MNIDLQMIFWAVVVIGIVWMYFMRRATKKFREVQEYKDIAPVSSEVFTPFKPRWLFVVFITLLILIFLGIFILAFITKKWVIILIALPSLGGGAGGLLYLLPQRFARHSINWLKILLSILALLIVIYFVVVIYLSSVHP